MIHPAGEHSSVDRDNLAGSVGGLARGKIDRRGDEFFGCAEACHRRAHQQFLAARAVDDAAVERGWEDAGRDYSTWVCPNGFGLDVIARELAGMYPALGLGEGYGDEKDYAALLWDVLRVADPVMRNAEEMLREVAERIASMSEAAPF